MPLQPYRIARLIKEYMDTENSSMSINPNFFIWLYQLKLLFALLRGLSQRPIGEFYTWQVHISALKALYKYLIFYLMPISFPLKVCSFNLVLCFVGNYIFWIAFLSLSLPMFRSAIQSDEQVNGRSSLAKNVYKKSTIFPFLSHALQADSAWYFN